MTPLQPRRRRCGSAPSSSPSSSSSGTGKVTLACSLHFLTLVDIAPAAVRARGSRPPACGAPSPPPAAPAAPGSPGRGGRGRARRGPRPSSQRREPEPSRRRRPPSTRGSSRRGWGCEEEAGGRAGRWRGERLSRLRAAAMPPRCPSPVSDSITC